MIGKWYCSSTESLTFSAALRHCITREQITMTVAYDFPSRTGAAGAMTPSRLEDKFEVIKEIGDGSFGSVHLARVRTAGAHVAKRGTMVTVLLL